MGFFHQNIKFLRLKQGFSSIQKWGDFLGEPAGKVREYENKSFPKEDFLMKLREKLNVNLDLLLTLELNEFNYDKIFHPPEEKESGEAKKSQTSEVFNLLMQAKNISDLNEKNKLIDQAIVSTNKIIDENAELKNELIISIKKRQDIIDNL